MRLWKTVKNSLTWRIILLTAIVQFFMLAGVLTYQQHLANQFARSFIFLPEDVANVFESVVLDDDIALTQIDAPGTSVVWEEHEVSEQDNIDQQRLEKLWSHITQNNPEFWYSYQTQDKFLSHGEPLNDALKMLDRDIALSSSIGDCVRQSEVVSSGDLRIYNAFSRCHDGSFTKAQFGGLEADYQPPQEINSIYVEEQVINGERTFIAFALTLIIITPGIIYFLLIPMRHAASQVAKVSPDGKDKKISLEAIPIELHGFVTALNSAFDRLDEGYTRERQFRNAMAHEIRTPLTVLRARLEDDVPAEELTSLLKTDIRSIQRLVDRLLELAKVATLARDFEDVDLVRETRAACAECGAAALNANLDLDLESPENKKIIVQANSTALRLAIVNVINNAIHHSDTNQAIEVKVLRTGAVTVRDHGAGIADDVKDSIFNPFSRNRQSKGRGAHGLGLAIVAEVMRYSHGQVVANNAIGGGAIFELYFKLSRES